MREILFRGKRTDNGEWVKGFYVCIPDTHYIMTGKFDSLTNGIINSEAYKVDPSTVGQFTGLEDKLGTKIFEGDVIDDLGVEYIVVFDSDYAQFRGKFDGWNAEISHIASRCEVIGNIHDNPELLEVSGNE
ncbi:MAG: YopX family protein [Oscillospiraceae bacterium]